MRKKGRSNKGPKKRVLKRRGGPIGGDKKTKKGINKENPREG